MEEQIIVYWYLFLALVFSTFGIPALAACLVKLPLFVIGELFDRYEARKRENLRKAEWQRLSDFTTLSLLNNRR